MASTMLYNGFPFHNEFFWSPKIDFLGLEGQNEAWEKFDPGFGSLFCVGYRLFWVLGVFAWVEVNFMRASL